MKTPLIKIDILSIYKISGQRVPLPKRMAFCTPDTHDAIKGIAATGKAIIYSPNFLQLCIVVTCPEALSETKSETRFHLNGLPNPPCYK